MNVEQLLITLSNGELSNLSMSGSGSGTITTQNHAKIIGYTNDALKRLYTQFILREGSVKLQLDTSISLYNLLAKHSVVDGTEDDLYILDDVGPRFTDDVVKVLYAYGENGREYTLNDPKSDFSIYTPSATQVQITAPLTGVVFELIYQAKHPLLDPTSPDTLAVELQHPDFLDEALKAYIAYKVYSHMNGQENAAKAAEHMSMYTTLCQSVVDNDLVNNTSASTNERFKQGGWV